ncbi:MAG: single-stranded DNA-binding protein [Gemmatimonadota bacterium]
MADRSINKVILIGNLGKDPELRHTASGKAVASFSVATNRSWNAPDGTAHEETEWHNIVVWDRLAEICQQYLQKGRKVYLEGRLQTRSWDDKSGQKRYTTEIVANQMIILDAPGGAGAGGARSGAAGAARGAGARAGRTADGGGDEVGAEAFPETDEADDDLPF